MKTVLEIGAGWLYARQGQAADRKNPPNAGPSFGSFLPSEDTAASGMTGSVAPSAHSGRPTVPTTSGVGTTTVMDSHSRKIEQVPRKHEELNTSPGKRVTLETSPGKRIDLETSPGKRIDLETSPGKRIDVETSPGKRIELETSPGGRIGLETSPGWRADMNTLPGERDDLNDPA